MKSFDELKLYRSTLRALDTMEIKVPTPIQARALPPLLEGRDVIGQARTGSGKTLAFAIPLVETIDTRIPSVQALVLTPTRELAQQVEGVIKRVSIDTGIRTALIIGGRSVASQEAALRSTVHVVVGAPGRVLAMIRSGVLKTSHIRYLVLDEADEMLDQGFAPDVERILATLPAKRQTALFSATVPAWVHNTAAKHMHRPEIIAVDARPIDRPSIDHAACQVALADRFQFLCRLLDDRPAGGSVIVFGRTKHGVKKLGRQLEGLGYPVAALQGNLSQNARDRVMDGFRTGKTPILLATNVAARGLDVDHVELVINYELPESAELLTHRVGRTGRMGREGRAITLVVPDDHDRFRKFDRDLGGTIRRIAATEVVPGFEGSKLNAPAAPAAAAPTYRVPNALPRRSSGMSRPTARRR